MDAAPPSARGACPDQLAVTRRRGHYATQLARRAVGPEGKIVGVCCSAPEALARRLGCDDVVPYDRVPGDASLAEYLAERYGLSTEYGGFDAVIDAYGEVSSTVRPRQSTSSQVGPVHMRAWGQRRRLR